MGFTNIAAAVELAPGSTVGIDGPVDTSGSSNLGINTLPSGNIPATSSVTVTPTSNTAPVQLLPNSSGSVQYILISCVITNASTYIAGGGTSGPALFCTGTASQTLAAQIPDKSTGGGLIQLDLHDMELPVGAGVGCRITNAQSANLVTFTLYYAQIDTTNPYVSASMVKGAL